MYNGHAGDSGRSDMFRNLVQLRPHRQPMRKRDFLEICLALRLGLPPGSSPAVFEKNKGELELTTLRNEDRVIVCVKCLQQMMKITFGKKIFRSPDVDYETFLGQDFLDPLMRMRLAAIYSSTSSIYAGITDSHSCVIWIRPCLLPYKF